jgi:Zn-dependent peptidase ImmA (M78 family)/transcriptional regulator with XRE-family HTH domain
LEQAREARGLTAVALAEMVGVKSANISQYEHGKQSPSPAILDKLAQVLNVPTAFFLKPIRNSDMDGINYRSMSVATKSARGRVEARYDWLKEIVAYLAEFVDFPVLKMPSLHLPDDFHRISMENIEDLAKACRAFWNLGGSPISDAVLLLENSGVIEGRGEMAAETLDAFSQWPDDEPRPYVFLGSDKASAVRSRFDALHELGHLLIHRNVEKRELRNNASFKLMEAQCHRFASAMLLPAEAYRSELVAPTLNGFLTLKARWKTSIAGQIVRCEQLGILNADSARRMWINLNRRGWRSGEPLDDRLPSEQPRLLQRSVRLVIESGLKTKSQLLDDLCLGPRDVEALMCLPVGFFENPGSETLLPRLKSDTVIQFKPRGG